MAASTSAAATTTASARAVHFSKRLDMADLTHTDGRDAWRHDGEDSEYRAHSRYSKPLDPGLSQLRSGSLSPTPAERRLVRELAPARRGSDPIPHKLDDDPLRSVNTQRTERNRRVSNTHVFARRIFYPHQFQSVNVGRKLPQLRF